MTFFCVYLALLGAIFKKMWVKFGWFREKTKRGVAHKERGVYRRGLKLIVDYPN